MSISSKVEIEVHGRLHLGLVAMHQGGPRRNGGIGFLIESPKARVVGRSSERIEIRDERRIPFGQNELQSLLECLENVKEVLDLSSGIEISIEGDLPTHFGFGSGTCIRLGCMEALCGIGGVEVPQKKLLKLSKRGGTSGVGSHAYFNGGFIFDLGVKDAEVPFLPSSAAVNPEIPLLLARTDFPAWPIGICIPRSIPALSQSDERDFFKRTLPLKLQETSETAHIALFGVQASLLESDYTAFCRAVNEMQKTRWKTEEWEVHGAQLRANADYLRELGADCVGLTSLGPSLFFLAKSKVLETIRQHSDQMDADILLTRASNSGRIIKLDAS